MKRAVQMLLASVLLSACAHVQPVNTPAQNDWARALSAARHDVAAGNYVHADSILGEFARTHPGTSEARDSGFWRGMYLIDPTNQHGSLADGIAALDAYLAADSAGLYHEQAVVLRRTAVAAEMASIHARGLVGDSSQASAVKDTLVVSSRSKDEQIAALKDQLAKSKEELAKVNAELDRIKKRLANPSN
jgi:hypothetical protein